MQRLRLLAISSVVFMSTCAVLSACSSDSDPNADPADAGEDAPDGSNVDSVDASVDVDAELPWGDATIQDAHPDAYGDAARDGSSDADPDAEGDGGLAPTGAPCPTPGEIQSTSCGTLCGVQKRFCGQGTDGGFAWGAWGTCVEKGDGCIPGTIEEGEDCGYCGHRNRVCQNDCTFADGLCMGVGVCDPGSRTVYAGLSCSDGGVRISTCDDSCQWSTFSACSAPPADTAGQPIDIGATIGRLAFGTVELTDDMIPGLQTGSCPVELSEDSTPYAYLQVNNPTDKTATVSIWHSMPSASDQAFATILAAYPGTTIPVSDEDRKACLTRASDYCSAPFPTCQYPLAGLFDEDAVTIPPHGSIVVYSAANVAGITGTLVVNVRTLSLVD